jgi:hypothetical protein
MARFDGTWWSVEIPANWVAEPQQDCATFHAMPPIGTLQISSARKNSGPVTQQDLLEFVEEDVLAAAPLKDVNFGLFSGYSTQYVKEGLSRSEWWLKQGHLMLFVTYYVDQEVQGVEQGDVEAILRSLRGQHAHTSN